jgi:single-strand DNA-binding protein
LVAIDGRIQTGSYDDQNGNKRYTTEVVADSVTFLESKNQASNSSNNMASEPTPYDYQDQTTAPTNNVNIEDDPFADFGDTVSIDDNFLD